MNRREMMQAGLSVLAAAGVEGEIQVIAPVNPVGFVLRVKSRMPPEARMQINKEWKEIWRGTPLDGIPMVCLSEGMSLEVIDMPNGKAFPNEST